MCSSKSGDSLTSLDQYISRMKPGQKQIYYITGQDRKQLEKSPFLEKLLNKGYEVWSSLLNVSCLITFFTKESYRLNKKLTESSGCIGIWESHGLRANSSDPVL
jgi:HSP90 family molecular chaperone